MKSTTSNRVVQRLAWIASALAVCACNSQSSGIAGVATASASSPVADVMGQTHSLTIYGYNYTDTGIGSFEVNGRGGGNLEVSIPTAGGGKSACCVAVYAPIRTPQTVKIKWTRDLETWCEQEVMLNPPLSPDPEYFEVHFYQDGRIEVAATEIDSPPRLQLERAYRGSRHQDAKRNVNNDAKFARCKRGYK